VDELAGSCYRDRLGYDRALRQLAQRLVLPTGILQASGRAHWGSWMPGKMAERFHVYIRSVQHLLQPDTDPVWRLDDLLRERGAEHKLAWNDPYDRVALFVGQAAFFAFLLTGATLQERPPEADYEYSMPFELFWKEHFHRNLELQEKAQPSGP
jgi:hypothetical protein